MENKIKKVSSYEEISKLIFLNLKKDVITNNFVSKEDFENEINNGTLYYISFKQGLFIFRDRGDFFILNYYLRNVDENEMTSIIHEEINKTVVVEVVGKNEEDAKYIKACNIFESVGMNKAIERVRFSKNKKEDISENSENKGVGNVNNEALNIEVCEIEDLEQVYELLKSNFDKYYGCIPSIEILKVNIISKNVYKATLDNKIIGVLRIKKGNNNSEIRHLVVEKLYRNMGIASKLIQKYDNAINTNKTVWTGRENISAQKVYENNGYVIDGYVSRVFLLNKK